MFQLLGLLTGIPALLGKGIDAYIAKTNGNVQEAVTLMQADRDLTAHAMDHAAWWIGWSLFVFPLGVRWAKVILWDNVLGLGHTDPLYGDTAMWAGWIVLSLFGMQAAGGIVSKITGIWK